MLVRNEGRQNTFFWPSYCRLFVVLPLEVLCVILYFTRVMRLRNSMPKQINVYVYIYMKVKTTHRVPQRFVTGMFDLHDYHSEPVQIYDWNPA